jgi:hypothetical protein
MVPQLASWIRSLTGTPRTVVLVTIGLVLLSCWYLFYNRNAYVSEFVVLFFVDEVLNWALFGCTIHLLAASAPDWIRSFPFPAAKSAPMHPADGNPV